MKCLKENILEECNACGVPHGIDPCYKEWYEGTGGVHDECCACEYEGTEMGKYNCKCTYCSMRRLNIQLLNLQAIDDCNCLKCFFDKKLTITDEKNKEK